MKPIGIFYATREGHTRLIAERIAIALRTLGLRAETHDLRASSVELGHYDAAILAASVHAGSHEAEMSNFVKQHRAQLDAMPNAFLSVTLSQVGVEDLSRPPADRARFAADVESVIENFRRQTGWNPKQVKPVAGALTYSQYNFLIRFIMKRIARKAGAPTDTSRDYEFTSWTGLDAFAANFANEIRGVNAN